MYRSRTVAVGFLALVVSMASVLVLAGADDVSSTPGPTMRLDPAVTELTGFGGETFTIDVLIEDVTNLGGFEFEVHFDDSIANLDVQLGPFLGSEGADVTCVQNAAPGIAVLSCVIKGPAAAPSGSGVVANLDFSLKLPFVGIGQLFLQACSALNPDGDPLVLIGCKDGSFVVPTPVPVGGVSVDARLAALPLDSPEKSGGRLNSSTGLLAVGAGAVLTLCGVIWYVRRRSLAP